MASVEVPVKATVTVQADKPGYKTTEFWLKLAAIVLTALYASGVIPVGGTWDKVIAIGATILGALGYTVGRSLVKAAAAAPAAAKVDAAVSEAQKAAS